MGNWLLEITGSEESTARWYTIDRSQTTNMYSSRGSGAYGQSNTIQSSYEFRPFVTIHHHELSQELEERYGGWLSPLLQMFECHVTFQWRLPDQLKGFTAVRRIDEGEMMKTQKAIRVMEILEKHGQADVFAYEALLNGYCKADIEYLNNMISDGGLPSIVSYNSILDSLCKNGHADEALNIFKKLGEVGCPPDAISYNTLFGALWSSGDEIRALGMILDMLSKGIDPNKVTYSSLISYLCRDGFMDQAIELLVDMMESHKYQPAVINYNAVIYGLCKGYELLKNIRFLFDKSMSLKPMKRIRNAKSLASPKYEKFTSFNVKKLWNNLTCRKL
ncbi:hypothetical protein RYX36_014572 [Vicia faba]